MNPLDVAKRIRGFSISILGFGGGVSWTAPRPAAEIAQEVLTYLEDKRVLYNDYELEVPQHCVDSVMRIREFFTDILRQLKNQPGLPANLRVMRDTCREFLDTVQKQGGPLIRNGTIQALQFAIALGCFRSTIGFHIAIIAANHKLGVEGDLAKCLPPKEEDDE